MLSDVLAGGALLVSVVALVLSRRDLRKSREDARRAEDSAADAKKAAKDAADALQRSAAAAERAEAARTAAWKLTKLGDNRWDLTNVGDASAFDIEVKISGGIRNETQDPPSLLRPQEAMPVRVFSSWQSTQPVLTVAWNNNPGLDQWRRDQQMPLV